MGQPQISKSIKSPKGSPHRDHGLYPSGRTWPESLRLNHVEAQAASSCLSWKWDKDRVPTVTSHHLGGQAFILKAEASPRFLPSLGLWAVPRTMPHSWWHVEGHTLSGPGPWCLPPASQRWRGSQPQLPQSSPRNLADRLKTEEPETIPDIMLRAFPGLWWSTFHDSHLTHVQKSVNLKLVLRF